MIKTNGKKSETDSEDLTELPILKVCFFMSEIFNNVSKLCKSGFKWNVGDSAQVRGLENKAIKCYHHKCGILTEKRSTQEGWMLRFKNAEKDVFIPEVNLYLAVNTYLFNGLTAFYASEKA